LVILVCGLLLAGCDRFYGVESRTTFHTPVDVECLGAALASVPEAAPVAYQRQESRSTVANDWLYGERGADILELIQSPNEWDFSNSRRRMGVAIPHDQLVHFVPLMQKVNQAIQARCGLPVASLKATAVGETKSSGF
jgi:hypothetical protein